MSKLKQENLFKKSDYLKDVLLFLILLLVLALIFDSFYSYRPVYISCMDGENRIDIFGSTKRMDYFLNKRIIYGVVTEIKFNNSISYQYSTEAVFDKGCILW